MRQYQPQLLLLFPVESSAGELGSSQKGDKKALSLQLELVGKDFAVGALQLLCTLELELSHNL